MYILKSILYPYGSRDFCFNYISYFIIFNLKKFTPFIKSVGIEHRVNALFEARWIGVAPVIYHDK